MWLFFVNHQDRLCTINQQSLPPSETTVYWPGKMGLIYSGDNLEFVKKHADIEPAKCSLKPSFINLSFFKLSVLMAGISFFILIF